MSQHNVLYLVVDIMKIKKIFKGIYRKCRMIFYKVKRMRLFGKERKMTNTVIIFASLNSESLQTLLLEWGLNLLYSYKGAQKEIAG